MSLVIAGGMLAGCGGSSHDSQPSPSSSPLRTSDCSQADKDRCYPLPDILPAYCEVQQARQFFADGKLKPSELPDWADKTVRDGTPLIVDFRHPNGEPPERKLDLLDPFLDQHHLRIDQREIDRCIDNTNDSDIAKTQGGPYVPHGTT